MNAFLKPIFGLVLFFLALNQCLASGTPAANSNSALPRIGQWPVINLIVTNQGGDTISANQVFISDSSITFPEIIPKRETAAYQFKTMKGILRGVVFFYIKDKAAAVRFNFDGRTLKIGQMSNQAIRVTLQGQGCGVFDGIQGCFWQGNQDVLIKAILNYELPQDIDKK
jgi:hypothetical protein